MAFTAPGIYGCFPEPFDQYCPGGYWLRDIWYHCDPEAAGAGKDSGIGESSAFYFVSEFVDTGAIAAVFVYRY